MLSTPQEPSKSLLYNKQNLTSLSEGLPAHNTPGKSLTLTVNWLPQTDTISKHDVNRQNPENDNP